MRQLILFFVCIGGAGMLGLGATATNSIIPSILALILFYGYLYYVISRFLNKRRRNALKTQSLREQQIKDLENREKLNEALEHLTSLVEKYERRDGVR